MNIIVDTFVLFELDQLPNTDYYRLIFILTYFLILVATLVFAA